MKCHLIYSNTHIYVYIIIHVNEKGDTDGGLENGNRNSNGSFIEINGTKNTNYLTNKNMRNMAISRNSREKKKSVKHEHLIPLSRIQSP